MRDRGAVEDDRSRLAVGARRRRAEGAAFGDAHLDPRGPVVERQIDQALGVRRDGDLDGVGDGRGAPVLDEAPAPGRALIQVHAADAGGRHVRHGQRCVAHRPAHGHPVRVGHETQRHAGRVAAQAPHAGRHRRAGARRQPVIINVRVLEGPALDRQGGAVKPDGLSRRILAALKVGRLNRQNRRRPDHAADAHPALFHHTPPVGGPTHGASRAAARLVQTNTIPSGSACARISSCDGR